MSQAETALSPRVARQHQISLRELGVYVLPDQRQFVASAAYAEGCCLYSLSAWENFGVAEYWVDTQGQLISRGQPTQWGVEDLKDTGRTL